MFKDQKAIYRICLLSLASNVLLLTWMLRPGSQFGKSHEECIRIADRSAKLAKGIILKQNAYMYGGRPEEDPLLQMYGRLLTDEVPTLRSDSILLLMRYGKSERAEIETIFKRRLTEEKHPEVFESLIFAVVQLDPDYLPKMKELIETSISEPDLKNIFTSSYKDLKRVASDVKG